MAEAKESSCDNDSAYETDAELKLEKQSNTYIHGEYVFIPEVKLHDAKDILDYFFGELGRSGYRRNSIEAKIDGESDEVKISISK